VSQKPILGPSVRLLLMQPLTPLQLKSLDVWMASISSIVEKRRPNSRRWQKAFEQAREKRELLALQLQLWHDESASTLAGELQHLAKLTLADAHEYWELRVTDGSQFGYRITSAQRTFGLRWQSYEPDSWQDEAGLAQAQQIMHKLHALPKQQITITAFDDKPEDHTLLAWMLADLWQLLGGWVQVGMRKRLFTAEGRATWSAEDSRALLTQCGGQWHEITAGKRLTYLVDGDCLREWGFHSDCYMGHR
jgi:hypothetical protein